MSRFAILALCVQLCLIKAVLSQQRFPCNQVSYAPVSAPPTVSVAQSSLGTLGSSCGGYGGQGTGKVGVSGDIGASGQTCVVGSVPVLGQVDFSGTVPAAGSVSISGQCGCGCAS